METFEFTYEEEKIFQDIAKYRRHYLHEIIAKYENPDSNKSDSLIDIKTLKVVGDKDVYCAHFGTLSTNYNCEPAQKLIEQIMKENKNNVKNQNSPNLGKNIGKKASVIAVRRKPKTSNIKPEVIGEKKCQDSISEVRNVPLDELGNSSKVLDGSGKVYDDRHKKSESVKCKKSDVAVKRKEFPVENSCKNVSFDERNSKSFNNKYNLKKQCIEEDTPRKDEFPAKIPCNHKVSSADSSDKQIKDEFPTKNSCKKNFGKCIANQRNSKSFNNMRNLKKQCIEDIYYVCIEDISRSKKDEFPAKITWNHEVSYADSAASNLQPSNNVNNMKKVYSSDKQIKDEFPGKTSSMKEVHDADRPASNNGVVPKNEEVSCVDTTLNLSNSTSSNCASVLTEPCTKNRKRKFTHSDDSPVNRFYQKFTTCPTSRRLSN